MNEVRSMPDTTTIPDWILRIRGHQVMSDKNLAELYGVTTKRLNQQVRRNLSRFPGDFMFQLSLVEVERLRSQIVTSKPGRGGQRYRPLVFTEQGVAMLSTVLNSERAIQVNIAIMRAFVKLRHAILAHRDLGRRIEKVEGRLHIAETDIRLVRGDVEDLKSKPKPRGLKTIKGFETLQ